MPICYASTLSTVLHRWGKKLLRMLLGDEDKYILHDLVDDLLAFTPDQE